MHIYNQLKSIDQKSLGIRRNIEIKIYNLYGGKNGNFFSSTELINECRYPFRTPNPADTVTTIINELKTMKTD